MKKICVIHIGMHKTGSTSIQVSLDRLRKFGEFEYLELDTPNHSLFLSTAFREHPHLHHIHRRHGRSETDVKHLKKIALEKLTQRLEQADSETVVISAEDLTVFSKDDLILLKKFLTPHFEKISIIGYVRPPASYMESAFQEQVKGGLVTFNPNNFYPHYRQKFEKFDAIFGKENVALVKFSKNELYKEDVVKDFCNRLGYDIQDQDIHRVNETLSLEAVACLYAQRKFGSGFGAYQDATKHNNILLRALSKIGNNKLSFGKEIINPMLSMNSDDIKWMEDRLGQTIIDTAKDSDHTINSELELLDVAEKQSPQIIDLIYKTSPKNATLKHKTAAACVDMLRTSLINQQPFSEAIKIKKEIPFKERLKKLGDRNAKAADSLREFAVILESLGELGAARNVIEQALELRPNGDNIKKIKDRIYKKQQ